MAWIQYNLNPLQKQTGDCVVRAISFATGKTWDETYWDLAEKGFERAEMPSWNSTWWDLLKEYGFRRYVIPDSCPSCYTVEDFCREYPVGKYVLFIPYSSEQGGHVVAIEDGNDFDTWDSTREIPLVFWRKES